MCRTELGEERGAKRGAVSLALPPDVPAQPVVKTYSEDRASSSTDGSVVDLRNANTDVSKLSASDMLKCPSCQHDNAKWFKRCMNCGVSLLCGIQVPVDGGPQPMEGMADDSTGEDSIQKGHKRAHREEVESQGDLSTGMSVDQVEDQDWDQCVQERRPRKVPCILMKGANQDRALNIASIQDLPGEFYVWEEPACSKPIKGIRKISLAPVVKGQGKSRVKLGMLTRI